VTFDGTKSNRISPMKELKLDEIKDETNSMRSKSTPGISKKLSIVTPMSPNFATNQNDKKRLSYTQK
jgi:hypothetical protein